MEKFLFRHDGSTITDALALNATIVALHRLFGADKQYNVWNGAKQACPELWENNPNIDPSITSTNADRILKFEKPVEAVSGFEKNISESFGVKAMLRQVRPEIHLTDKEKTDRPMKEPYWILMPGDGSNAGKHRWPLAYWRRLVDACSEQVFVQSGFADSGTASLPLKRVVNLFGKLTLRQTIVYFYHAEGVICEVNGGLYLAAAFQKPCIVIAGGQVGFWWEQYSEQAYLATAGQLPCCKEKSCWKDVSACSLTEPVDGQLTSKCVQLVTPVMVASAMSSYKKHGRVFNAQSVAAVSPRMQLAPATVCVGLFGDNFDQHKRCVTELCKTVSPPHSIIVGCCHVGQQTQQWLAELKSLTVVSRDDSFNAMLRELFNVVKTEQLVYVHQTVRLKNTRNWLSNILAFVATQRAPSLLCKQETYPLREGQLDWIQAAEWFTGKPPMISTKDQSIAAQSMAGHFFAIPKAVIEKLKWPDSRLSNEHAHTMLPEACYQQDIRVTDYSFEKLGIEADDFGLVVYPGAVSSAPASLQSSRTFYITELVILEMLKDKSLYELCPELLEKKDLHQQQIVQLETARDKAKSNCAGCARARLDHQLSLSIKVLLDGILPSFVNLSDEQKSFLLTYVRKRYNEQVVKIFSLRVGRAIVDRTLLEASTG